MSTDIPSGTHGGMIHIESGIAGALERRGQPFVHLTWGEMKAQLTPAEARAHALHILECAEAAESDALLWRWLDETTGVTDEQKAAVLIRFRELRG